jgi:two-component system LytT family response regulator
MPRALIIEDEAIMRSDLRTKLAAHPEVAVAGEAATVRGARELLARPDYELVFLDIQLIGGDAFDLVPDVRLGARIVFTTAHDEFALRAFESNALDYLLKPVVPARLADALRRFAAADGAREIGEPLPPLPPAPALKLDDTVFLRCGRRARFVPVGEISHIAARDNYSEVRLIDGTGVILRKSLKAWADTLPPANFIRVHRTQIVNLAHIARYERDGDERTLLFVVGAPAAIPASRDRWTEVRERLGRFARAP